MRFRRPTARSCVHMATNDDGMNNLKSSLMDYESLSCSMSFKKLQAQTFKHTSLPIDDASAEAIISSLKMHRSFRAMCLTIRDSNDSLYSETESDTESEPSESEKHLQHIQNEYYSDSKLERERFSGDQQQQQDEHQFQSHQHHQPEQSHQPQEHQNKYRNKSLSSSMSTNFNGTSYSGQKYITVSTDAFNDLQNKMRRLEDQVHKQAAKQLYMDNAIEIEVEQRTKRILQAMDEKVAIIERSRELEIERQTQVRVAERWNKLQDFGEHQRDSVRTAVCSTSSSTTTDQNRSSRRDSQQSLTNKLSWFQFRNKGNERTSFSNDRMLKRQKELQDTIGVLRLHILLQERQLEEAKQIITKALLTQDDLEYQLFEAMRISVDLDARLDSATKDLALIKNRKTCPQMDSFPLYTKQNPRSFSESTKTCTASPTLTASDSLLDSLSFRDSNSQWFTEAA